MGTPALTSSRLRTQVVRLVAALMVCLTIFIGVAGILELRAVGFPDGHRTAYDIVVEKPFALLSGLSIISGGYFLSLFFTAARPRCATKLSIAVLLYLLLVPGAHWAIEYGLTHFTRIDHGQGG